MDGRGRNVMYQLKPVLQPNTQFQTTSSMYKLKTLQTSTILATDNVQAVNSTQISAEDEQVVARQETLLANLHQLQKDVSEFESKLKQLQSVQKASKQKHSSSLNSTEDEAIIRSAKFLYPPYVINADPSYPPYALLWLRKLWNKKILLNVTIHLHSSVQSLPEHLSVFDERLKDDTEKYHLCNLTFVWKKVGEDAQFVVTPIICKTVLGEVNILRFFEFIIGRDKNEVQYIRKNEVLDLAHQLNHASSKDKQSIIAQLQKRLGNEKWLCGSVPTIADAAVWSSLTRLKRASLPAPLKKYFTSCSEFLGVNISS